jgi:hypothetical protein
MGRFRPIFDGRTMSAYPQIAPETATAKFLFSGNSG